MKYVFPVGLLLVCMFYYYFNPFDINFPIYCVWYQLTGLNCPACGTQRAIHALMYGHIVEAIKYNYFFFLSAPYACLAVLSTWYNDSHTFDVVKGVIFNNVTIRIYIFLFFAWWVLRNMLGI